MIEPHGGSVVDRVVDEDHARELRAQIDGRPAIDMDLGQFQDLLNLANGRYSPLEGFMERNDFLKVINDMTLEDGTIWTLPIFLDVDSNVASELTIGSFVPLRSPDGQTVGAIDIADVYRINKKEAVEKMFGTTDRDHPGVRRFLDRNQFFVGGRVALFDGDRYNGVDLNPKETRVLFEEYGWETVAGFQTRNAPHRAHEYIQKSALEQVDGLLVQPKLGDKKPGDYCDEAIISGYRALFDNYYPQKRAVLTVFPSKMNYAGPREAVFDAIIRKNQGCTHFIVGRDHAGVKDYYGGYESQNIFGSVQDIGISPMFYSHAFYCEVCDGMASEKTCPHEDKSQIKPSGTKIRDTIKSGSKPSERIMRSEVAARIMEFDQPFVAESPIEGEP